MERAAIATRTASTGLLAIGALHVVWATGSSWPLPDSSVLTDAVVGNEQGVMPSAAACLAVAGLLGTAAALVDGRPRRAPAISRLGAAGVVATLATRAGFGLCRSHGRARPGFVLGALPAPRPAGLLAAVPLAGRAGAAGGHVQPVSPVPIP